MPLTLSAPRSLFLASLWIVALLAPMAWAQTIGGDDDQRAEAVADEPIETMRQLAVLETSAGTMVFELYPDRAPKTVENFARLAAADFYDGLPFYRVVEGHVIQAGDGGENDQPTVPAEFGVEHLEGTLGLARDEDPDSGSTEIYVCLEPRPHLDGRYAAFGRLVEGRDVLHAIGSAPVTEKWLEGEIAFHEPKEPVVIMDARIETHSIDEDDARATP